MMYLYKNKELDFVFQSHDRWLEDLDYHLKTLVISPSEKLDKEDFYLEEFCNHVNYWTTRISGSSIEKEHILSVIKEFNIPSFEGSLLSPELLIYEFEGESVYDDFSSSTLNYDKKSETLEFIISDSRKLVMSTEELYDIGGELIFDDDNEEEEAVFDRCDVPIGDG